MYLEEFPDVMYLEEFSRRVLVSFDRLRADTELLYLVRVGEVDPAAPGGVTA